MDELPQRLGIPEADWAPTPASVQAVVRALVQGAHTSQELQAILGVSSPGQLYHHLKELLAVGIVTQTGRSHYEVAALQVVPLLAILAAAFDLIHRGPAAHEADGSALQEQ